MLGPKRLDILNELVPAAKVAVLVNSSDPPARVELEAVQTGAQARGQQLLVLPANTEEDIENAFALIIQHGAGSLFVGAGATTFASTTGSPAIAKSACAPWPRKWSV